MIFDSTTILTGLLIFFARIIDVSIGTIRIISIVNSRIKTAFVLGFLEVSIWLVVISTVLSKMEGKPIIGVFYALGYASGNVVGIILEKQISFGNTLLRIISFDSANEIMQNLRSKGHQVIEFRGIDNERSVVELEIVCKKKDVPKIMKDVRKIEPDAYYVTESVEITKRKHYPALQPPTGWRSIFKRK
jgi:uncharacterized protein YebE (UPF0316 family)